MAHQMITVGGYVPGKILGLGAYGRVYHGTKSTAGQTFEAAIKEIWKNHPQLNAVASYEEEKSILQSCDHPNVVKLLHDEEQGDLLYLVLQFCNEGNLEQYLKREKFVPLESRLILCHDACQGLTYLHRKRILHRDLKPENLLIHHDQYGCSLILGDVGIGRFIPEGKTNQQATLTAGKGTPGWMAPEMHSVTSTTAHYNRECDIFGLGQCLAAILMHKEGEIVTPLEGIIMMVKHI